MYYMYYYTLKIMLRYLDVYNFNKKYIFILIRPYFAKCVSKIVPWLVYACHGSINIKLKPPVGISISENRQRQW